MKLGRLHIGLWRHPTGKIDFIWFEILSPRNGGCFCGCWIVTLLGVAITWLSDECK